MSKTSTSAVSTQVVNIEYSIDDIIVDSETLAPFQCQICLNSVVDFKKNHALSFDVLQCRNGHISCHECWERQLSIKSECPSCKVKTLMTELSRNIFLENTFRQLKVHCPNIFKESKFQGELMRCENGCPEVTTVESLEHHLKSCKFEYIKCPNNPTKCKYIIRKNQLVNHNSNICEFAIVDCEKCFEPIQKNTIQKHLESECSSFLVKCPHCTESFGRKQLQVHLDLDCPDVEIPCLYSVGGCTDTVKRSALSEHLASKNNHISFIQNMLDLSRIQFEQCALEYRKLERTQKDMEKRINNLESTVTLNSAAPHSNSNNGISSDTFSGKWTVNNWDKKLRDFPIGKSINSPFFYIGASKFFIMLYPNGNNDTKLSFVSVFLYKIFDKPTTVKYSLEAKNADVTKSYKSSHLNHFINNNGNGWFKWIENKPQNGFFSANSLTINIKIKIILDSNMVTE